MRRLFLAVVLVCACPPARAADWELQRISAPARVSDIETVNGQVRVKAGGLWYAIKRDDGNVTLQFIDNTPGPANLPDGALPDGQVATGQHDVARAWLAEPTERYDHGI